MAQIYYKNVKNDRPESTGYYVTSDNIWYSWINSTVTTTASTTMTDAIWSRWIVGDDDTSTNYLSYTTTNAIWYAWQPYSSNQFDLPVDPPVELSAEQREAQAQAQAQAEQRHAEWQAARLRAEEEAREVARETARLAAEADRRAEALLQAQLNAEQQAEFAENRSFTVVTQNGGRRYRIRYGWAGNIERLDEQGRPIEKLCVHPKQMVPFCDNLLTQKLFLECAEEEFLRIANCTPIHA